MKNAKKFRDIIFWLFIIVEFVVCAVSYHTSRNGLLTQANVFTATIVALSGALFAFAVYLFLSRKFPQATKEQRMPYIVLIIVFGFILFGFSTQFSVIDLGGKEAVGIHMQKVLFESDRQGLMLLKKGSEEANMIPQFESLEKQFLFYAQKEFKGDYSGHDKRGDVMNTLENTSITFGSMAKNLKENERIQKELYESLKEAISEGRDILTSDKPTRRANLEFSQKLAIINELLTKMAEISSLDYINSVNRNLTKLAIVVTDETADWQVKTIERLRGTIEASQEIVKKMTSETVMGEIKVQTFQMISMSKAVFLYAGDIFYAWAYALVLDFCPLFFVLLLTIGLQQEQTEITLEEAQRVKADAESAWDKIQKNAKELIRDTIDELKPGIVSDATAAKSALENSVKKIVEETRNTVNSAKKELELTTQEQLVKLKEFKFTI